MDLLKIVLEAILHRGSLKQIMCNSYIYDPEDENAREWKIRTATTNLDERYTSDVYITQNYTCTSISSSLLDNLQFIRKEFD
ncbi:hypothetical protein ACET3Z_005719 [Daucus carota]